MFLTFLSNMFTDLNLTDMETGFESESVLLDPDALDDFLGNPAWLSKSIASLVGLVFNFVGRRFWVFPEKGPTRLVGGRPAVDG